MRRIAVAFALVGTTGLAQAVTAEIGDVEIELNTRLTTGLVWRAQSPSRATRV